MNKKLLVAFGVLLALIIILPILSPQKSSAPPQPSEKEATSQQASPEPQQPQPIAAQAQPVALPPQAPQGLTAQTLVGTGWRINTQYGPVEVYLNANGQAVGVHAMAGQIPGNWRVHGNRLSVKVSAMGRTEQVQCTIQGNRVLYKGHAIQRLR